MSYLGFDYGDNRFFIIAFLILVTPVTMGALISFVVLVEGDTSLKGYYNIKTFLNFESKGEICVKIISGKVPTIDLADDRRLQVIVDKEEGRYLGHVSTVLLADNKTIIAVYIQGHGRGQAVMKRSVDGGLSWGERLKLPSSWSTLLQVPVIYNVLDDNEKERLLVFTGHYPIRMSVSEDHGFTWSELTPIGNFGGNVAMSDMIKLNDGRHMAFFHDDGRFINGEKKDMRYQLYKSVCGENSKVELYQSYKTDTAGWSKPQLDERTSLPDNLPWSKPELIYESYAGKKNKGDVARIYKTVSIDQGQSWDDPTPIIWHHDAYLAEAAVTPSPDKKQLALLMRENSRKYNSFVAISNDDGETWSEPTEVAQELTGDRHNICYAPDGRLVVTFRDTCLLSPTHGDWVAWVGTYDDMVTGGKGQYRIRLMKNYYRDDCGYAGLELLPDKTFVATTYGHWTKNEPPFILSVRFKLEDIEPTLP